MTNRTEGPRDLSRQVRAYYEKLFAQEGREDERHAFDQALTAVWDELLETKRYRIDPGFLLHVLVCTRFLRPMPSAGMEAIARVPGGVRATLLGGLRALKALDLPWLEEVFGPAGRRQAQEIWWGVHILLHRLETGTVVETPAFSVGSYARPMTARQRGRVLEAGIACVTDALADHPKPTEATVVLLRKFGLLEGGYPDDAAIAFVRQRGYRARGKTANPFSAVGNLVFLLRSSYDHLVESLNRGEACP